LRFNLVSDARESKSSTEKQRKTRIQEFYFKFLEFLKESIILTGVRKYEEKRYISGVQKGIVSLPQTMIS